MRADLGDPAGRRLACVLTRSPAIEVLHRVTVAPLTRTIRGIRSEVELGPDDGMPAARLAGPRADLRPFRARAALGTFWT